MEQAGYLAGNTRPYRVLVITRNLPPLIGGMERLVWHIADELSKLFTVRVVGPSGCRLRLPRGIKAMELPMRSLPWFLFLAMMAGLEQAFQFLPDIVLAGSGLTAPMAWLASRVTGARCVVYLHGLDIEADHPLYRLLWLPIFRRCDLVLVNSGFTRRLAVNAGISQDRIVILHPGVALPPVNDADSIRAAFRSRYGLGLRPLMLYVGRITPRKGLACFCRDIMPLVIAKIPEAVLAVIGDEAANALLKEEGERVRVERALDVHGMRDHLVFLGERAADDPELSAAYFAAAVLIFPVQSRDKDNEGFGMVAIEAAAHGLPTVAFAAGGVPDAVEDGVSGTLIEPGDHETFANAVIRTLLSPGDQAKREGAISFARRFEWRAFGEKLRSHICGLISSPRHDHP